MEYAKFGIGRTFSERVRSLMTCNSVCNVVCVIKIVQYYSRATILFKQGAAQGRHLHLHTLVKSCLEGLRYGSLW